VRNVVDLTTSRKESDLYIALEQVESWSGHYTEAAPGVVFEGNVKRFSAGDVLFSKLRPYLAKVIQPSQDGVCVGEFLVLRPNTASLDAAYMEQFLRAKSVIDAISGSTFGAKMPRADWQYIGSMNVVVPPPDEQSAIVRYLDAATADLEKATDAAHREIDLLREYRTRLIADVVTGKSDVREAAAHLPDELEEQPELLDEEPVAETSDLDAEESDGDRSEDVSRDA
jgi:type I restriction enzyme S subunit